MLLLATTGVAAQGSYRTLLLAAIEQRLLLFYISYGQLEREQADREKTPVYAAAGPPALTNRRDRPGEWEFVCGV